MPSMPLWVQRALTPKVKDPKVVERRDQLLLIAVSYLMFGVCMLLPIGNIATAVLVIANVSWTMWRTNGVTRAVWMTWVGMASLFAVAIVVPYLIRAMGLAPAWHPVDLVLRAIGLIITLVLAHRFVKNRTAIFRATFGVATPEEQRRAMDVETARRTTMPSSHI